MKITVGPPILTVNQGGNVELRRQRSLCIIIRPTA